DADTDAAQAKIEEVSKDKKAEVKVDADAAGAEAKIDRAARNRTARIKLDPYLDSAGIEAMRLRLSHENFRAKVKLETDKANLDRMVRNVESDIDRKFAKIFSTAGSAGGGGGGLFGGGAGAAGGAGGGMGKLAMLGDDTFLIAAGVIGLLAPALAMLATALASLPALLAAVALPIGAIALGKDGIQKALENVGLLDSKKGKTDFDKDKHKAGAELKKLQDSVSSEFEHGLTPVFRELVGLLPQVREGFVGIARGIVADIQGLSDAFTKGGGPDMIRNIMGNVGEMLNQAAPGLNSFATAILGLASKVSDHLPGLARFFDEWGGKFSDWVSKISGDGTLDKAVSGLKPVMDAVMSFFATMMESGLKLMGDPAMAQNIKDTLNGLTNLINESLPALNQVFGLITDFVRGLGLVHDPKSLDPATGKPGGPLNVEPAAPGSSGKFQWIAPPNPHSDDHSKMGLLDRLEDNMQNWGRDHNPFKGKDLHIPYEKQGFLDQLESDPLRFMDQRVGKPINDFGGMVSGGIGKGLGWMDQNVGKPMGNMFNGALDEAKKLPGQIGSVLGQVEQIASETWNKVSSAAKEQWDNIVKTCKDALGKLPGELANIGTQLMEGLKRGIEGGVHLVEGAVRNLAGLIPQWAKDMLGIKSPSTVMYDVGQNTVEGLQNGLDAGAQGVVDRAKAIAQQVQGALSAGFSPGTRSGAAQAAVEQAESMVGQSYVSGISDCSGAISQVYSAMTGTKTHFTTMADFAALGFKPGFKPGALNIGVTPLPGQSGHMAATLPDGRNFESGGRLGGGPKVGGGAAGARDAQFSQHWYYDGGGAVAGGEDVAGMQGEIKQSLQELDVERDKLQAQRDALPKGKETKDQRDALSEQLRQIKMARDALVTQRDELKLGSSRLGSGDAGKGGKGKDSMTEAASMITKALASALDGAKSAVMAGVGGLEHDLGIGGNGAIPKIAEFGLGWAQSELTNMINADFGLGSKHAKDPTKGHETHFHVNSVDEALQADQTIKNRQALQWKGR
ncbi:MAG: hypothetical protein ACXWNW_15365, partial [Isosphaeraceae bacterium]